jgi:hypothetical protein
MSTAQKYVDDPSYIKLHPNPAQAHFLFKVLENEADFICKDEIGYQAGFRAPFNGGRGCGKTNVLYVLIAESAFEFPRAKMGLASMTFRHVQDVVLSRAERYLLNTACMNMIRRSGPGAIMSLTGVHQKAGGILGKV